MSVVKFLVSRIFLRHFLLAIAATLVLIIIVTQLLAIYTRHGNEITMPDYTGLTLREIHKFNLGRDFEFVILDSIYDNTHPKGSIFSQDPLPGSKVKRDRKVYLTIIAVLPEQVRTPDLVDLTLRQAIATLETFGLKPGKLEFIPDIAKNAVLKQLHQGTEIVPGTLIPKGSVIDLVLGQGLGSERVHVPLLLGLTPVQVIEKLKSHYLGLGAAIYLHPSDSVMPRVYRQNPPYQTGAYMKMGETVDVWYKSELKFNLDSLLSAYKTDTILINDTIMDFDNF